MQKWEYLRMSRIRRFDWKLSLGDWDCEIDENEPGQQGWELTTIVPYSDKTAGRYGVTTRELWFFKRAIG